MSRTPRCWANVLDDCNGRLEHEHCISVAAVQHEDPNATRKQKEKVVVRHSFVQDGNSREYHVKVAKLSARMLCHGHNIGTSDLDAASGIISDAIAAHCNLARVHPRTVFEVDGALVERWLMKWAIDLIVAYSEGTRIGCPTVEVHQPTLELAEMVFGKRPVFEPYGVWFIPPSNLDDASSDAFTAHHWGPDGVTNGILFSIQGFRFVVSLADEDPPWAVLGNMMQRDHYQSVRRPRQLWSDIFGPSLILHWLTSLPAKTVVRGC